VLDEFNSVLAPKLGWSSLPRGVGVVADETSIPFRAMVQQQLRMFGVSGPGLAGDASVVATVIARAIPLIIADEDLYNAVTNLVGEEMVRGLGPLGGG
jgi:hypothetical protein